MARFEGEKRKFVVKWVGPRKYVDDARGRQAADIFFNRMIKRPGVAKLMHKLSKS